MGSGTTVISMKPNFTFPTTIVTSLPYLLKPHSTLLGGGVDFGCCQHTKKDAKTDRQMLQAISEVVKSEQVDNCYGLV